MSLIHRAELISQALADGAAGNHSGQRYLHTPAQDTRNTIQPSVICHIGRGVILDVSHFREQLSRKRNINPGVSTVRKLSSTQETLGENRGKLQILLVTYAIIQEKMNAMKCLK